MFKKIVSILMLTACLMITTPIQAQEFCSERTYTILYDELQTANKELPAYLKSKYGVSDYKKAKEFKYKVCGAAVHDCYSARNDKYFISNIPSVDKWGEFYFGLLQTEKISSIVHSVGWCESGYNPKTVSPDEGYGVFQITPDAIGDKNIKRNQLLDMEYNTQYGIYHMNKYQKIAKSKYGKYNSNDNPDFIQYLTLRGYNGGYKWIDRLAAKPDPLRWMVTGDYIDASKQSGRFVCFEKVNTVYPLKIYRTSETLIKKAF